MERTKRWNCESQSTGTCHADNDSISKLTDYIDSLLFDFQGNQLEADLLTERAYWRYLDHLDCRATADTIADNVSVMAFYA